MLVINNQNAFPKIIDTIIDFLRNEDKNNIISIENHKGNLEIYFIKEPAKEVLTLIKGIWIYFECDQNYSFKVVSYYREI